MKKLIALASVLALTASSGLVTVSAQCFDGYGYQVSCGSGGSGSSGGGTRSNGGSSNLQRDFCPDGDMTLSYYDGMCAAGVAASTEDDMMNDDDMMEEEMTTTTTDGNITVVTTTATDDTVMVTVDDEETIMNIRDEIMNNNAGNTPLPMPTFELPTRLADT